MNSREAWQQINEQIAAASRPASPKRFVDLGGIRCLVESLSLNIIAMRVYMKPPDPDGLVRCGVEYITLDTAAKPEADTIISGD